MSEQMYVEAFGSDDEVTFKLNVAETGEPVQIHLSTASGEATLHATNRTDIQVWLEVEGNASDDKVVTATWDGRRLDVAPAKVSGSGRVLRHHDSFDVRVEIPRSLLPRFGGPGIVARLNSASGELTVGEVAGDIRLATASGGLSLARLDGRIECRTASGDVDAQAVRGMLKVSSVSGEVSLSEAILDRWEINTVSGDVSGEVVLAGTGPYRLNTVSGDTDLRLGVLSGNGQPDAFTVEASTMSGDVDVDGESRKLGKRRWHIGSGANPVGTVKLTSVSGDASLTIESAVVQDDFRMAGGRWASQPWNGEAEPEPDPGSDKGQTDQADDHFGERIEETINRSIGKVDWKGIDRTIDGALTTAFGGREPAPVPTAPVPPSPPQAPQPPAAPQEPSAYTAPFGEAAATSGSVKPDPVAAVPSEEDRRLEILRRIERGELSVEEGMAQLDAHGSRARPDA